MSNLRHYIQVQTKWFRSHPIYYWIPRVRDNFGDWLDKWPMYYPEIEEQLKDVSIKTDLIQRILDKYNMPREEYLKDHEDQVYRDLSVPDEKLEKILRAYKPAIDILTNRKVKEILSTVEKSPEYLKIISG